MAAELARAHGVFRTAQVLRLDYSKLKARAAALSAKRKTTPPMLVELLSALPAGSTECLIELGRSARQNAYSGEGRDRRGPGRTEPGSVRAGVIQDAPQMRVLVAIEPVVLRKGQ
jgi:hypothetical protein